MVHKYYEVDLARGKKNGCAKVVTDPMEKISPNVIRQQIYEIVEQEFKGKIENAAEKLCSENPSNGEYYPFTNNSLYNVIHDKTPIKYHHLEAISYYFRIPTFMLLLFTRIRSEKEKAADKPVGEITEIRLLIEFLSELENTIENSEFDAKELKKWGELYGRGRLL